MATCKDCLHCEACKSIFEAVGYTVNGECVVEGAEKRCDQFADKSRFIELPCKVGDTVYAYCEDFFVILPYFVENMNIGYIGKSRNYIFYEANCHADETDELIDEIDFDFDDIGKTVFLTKEEAEAALAERSKE